MGGWGGIGSDDNFPIRQLLPLGLSFAACWAQVFLAKKCNTVDTVNFHAYHYFLWLKGKW